MLVVSASASLAPLVIIEAAPRDAGEPRVAARALYAHVNGARMLVVAAHAAAWVVLWLSFYTNVGLIPHGVRPEIDTVTLPRLETYLFGRYVGGANMHTHTVARDLLADVPYVGHFAVPFFFLARCLLAHRYAPQPRVRPFSYALTLAVTSFGMHAFQVFVPMSPPWHIERSGHGAASYAQEGDPGGLARLDVHFNSTFFRNMYRSSPIVHGAFPSMHVGWAVLVLLFQPSWRGRALSALHVAWVSWAALYLHHHYVLDVLGGYVFSLAGVWLARLLWLLVGRFVGGSRGFLGLLEAPAQSAEVRRRRETAADAVFMRALLAVVLFRGGAPWSAPDVWRDSMDAAARATWAPDLGDVDGDGDGDGCGGAHSI